MTLAPASVTRRATRKPTSTPKRMTETAFVRWALRPENLRVRMEWVRGEVILMAPANTEHSSFHQWLSSVIRIYVEEKDLGAVLGNDVMVRFVDVPSRRMPDIFFVAKSRTTLVKRNHFEGAPDVAIEIISPDSQSRDWREKFQEYEANGVREYWIIDPASRQVEAYALKRKKYRRIEEKAGVIHSGVINGFGFRTDWLTLESLPNILAAVRALGVKT